MKPSPREPDRRRAHRGSAPEPGTLAALEHGLPNDYTVFHGVHWTREYVGWRQFGEIDFVVLNRAGEVLFIEQKNGALEEGPGRLVKHFGGAEKDPVRQVHRSLDRVREKFRWQHGRPLALDYLVYLPDYQVKDLNAAGLDASRVVDALVVDEGQDFEAEWLEVLQLRRYTGGYDADGNQVLTPGQLAFESVHRFKGQEAPAVILADVDPATERLEREERLLYCGMTRATVRLDLVVQQDNPANRRFLEP